MQNAPSSSDGADYICAYCKRHAYVGLSLTSKTVLQFKNSTKQNLGDGKVTPHDETLVTRVGCRRWNRRCHSSSNGSWSAILYPIDDAGCHQGGELPLHYIFASEKNKNKSKWNIFFQIFLRKNLGYCLIYVHVVMLCYGACCRLGRKLLPRSYLLFWITQTVEIKITKDRFFVDSRNDGYSSFVCLFFFLLI